jgi:hypothetical protein
MSKKSPIIADTDTGVLAALSASLALATGCAILALFVV